MSRRQPYDNTAEQAVIGAALLDGAVIDRLADILDPAAFYRPAHSVLWRVLRDLRADGEATDPIAVTHHLGRAGQLDRVGGATYLHSCIETVPTTANADHYAEIVNSHHRNRVVATIGTRLTQAGTEGSDPAELLADTRARLDGLTDAHSWPEPVPLGERRQLPAFPVAAFPGWLADMVAAVAEFTQTPPDLAGCIALSALSTAGGGRAVVEVRGSWREPVNVYTVVAMHAGSRKTAAFALMTDPLLDAEEQLAEDGHAARVEAEQARKLAERQAQRAEGSAAAAGAGDQDAALAEAISATLHASGIDVPAVPRLVADDVTPEAAASLLAEQGGRLAILSAEGGVFATMAGRYANGTPNLEVLLKGHSGDLLRVDRKGRPAEHIRRPALTLGLAVQPDVLRDIARMPGFRGRGLLARILYSLPENIVGRRKIGPPSIPEPVAQAYAESLHALVLSLAGWTDPAVLPLTPQAGEEVLALEAELEPQLAPSAELGHIADWASKWVGTVVRIAGLLHLAEHFREGWGRPLQPETLQAASRIGRYFLDHALAVFDLMGADPVVDDARVVLDWIDRTQRPRFTRRDAFTGCSRARFRKVGDLEPALDLLTQHGHIRPVPAPEPPGRGRRPSPAYEVNPAVLHGGDG